MKPSSYSLPWTNMAYIRSLFFIFRLLFYQPLWGFLFLISSLYIFETGMRCEIQVNVYYERWRMGWNGTCTEG